MFGFKKIRRILGLGETELAYLKSLEEAPIEEVEEEISKLEKHIKNLESLKKTYAIVGMKNQIDENNKEFEVANLKYNVLISIRNKKKDKFK